MTGTDPDLLGLLLARGIDMRSVRALTTGQKNVTLLVQASSGVRFVVRQYATATADEVEYELAATEFLASRGFPTPPPIRGRDGNLAGHVGGRPAAVFRYAAGRHPAGLDSTVGDDLELGCQAAVLAGRLHSLIRGAVFPGRRTNRLDPLRRIQEFLRGPYCALPALESMASSLTSLAAKMSQLSGCDELPRGLVHNDISAHNLLVDSRTGSITALIDFDDCITSFLLYDLGRISEVWGRAKDGHVDRFRIRQLVDAYSSERPLTPGEAQHAVTFIAAYAAATGIGFLTGKLSRGETIGSDDSIAMSIALQLLGD